MREQKLDNSVQGKGGGDDKSPGLVVGLLKQKSSLLVIRSLKNQFLLLIVSYLIL